MNMLTSMSRALGRAHLGKVSVKAAEDEEKKKPEDEKKDDAAKKAEDEENKPAEDEKKDDAAAADHASAEDDEHEEPDGDEAEPKAKKAKKAEDGDDETEEEEDDDEKEMTGKSAVADARRRERARCAAILNCEFAERNLVLAKSLAFNTVMSRETAIQVLKDTPGATVVGRPERAARNPNLGAGGDAQVSAPQAQASRWDAAFKKANPRAKA